VAVDHLTIPADSRPETSNPRNVSRAGICNPETEIDGTRSRPSDLPDMEGVADLEARGQFREEAVLRNRDSILCPHHYYYYYCCWYSRDSWWRGRTLDLRSRENQEELPIHISTPGQPTRILRAQLDQHIESGCQLHMHMYLDHPARR
jgi:hypothetical protein